MQGYVRSYNLFWCGETVEMAVFFSFFFDARQHLDFAILRPTFLTFAICRPYSPRTSGKNPYKDRTGHTFLEASLSWTVSPYVSGRKAIYHCTWGVWSYDLGVLTWRKLYRCTLIVWTRTLDVWTHTLGVWTDAAVLWVSELILWVSELIPLYIECLTSYFSCLNFLMTTAAAMSQQLSPSGKTPGV